MCIKTLLLSSALALGSLALPASADDGVRFVVRHDGHHADGRHADGRHADGRHAGGRHAGRRHADAWHGYWRGSRHDDRSYAAHRYRHYVRPYLGYLWTHHRYLSAYAQGHATAPGHGHGRDRGHRMTNDFVEM